MPADSHRVRGHFASEKLQESVLLIDLYFSATVADGHA